MLLEKITSTQNNQIKFLKSLKDKKNILLNNQFLIEGRNIIKEAIELNLIEEIIFSTNEIPFEQCKCKRTYVSEKIIKHLSSNKTNEGIIAKCKLILPIMNIEKYRKVLLLDNINNPGNLGAIIRSAKAFQFDAIFTINNSTFAYGEKVIRSSQGAIFNFPIFEIENTNSLRNFNFYFFTLDSNATSFKQVEFTKPFILVFGNEANGINKKLYEKHTGQNVFLEIKNIDSLNLSIAASIAMYNLK